MPKEWLTSNIGRIVTVFFNGGLSAIYIVVFNLIISDKIGLAVYGEYSYQLATATVLCSLITLGTTTYSAKFLVEKIYAQEDYYLFVLAIWFGEFVKHILIVPIVTLILVKLGFTVDVLFVFAFSLVNLALIIPSQLVWQIRDSKQEYYRNTLEIILLNSSRLFSALILLYIDNDWSTLLILLVVNVFPYVVWLIFFCIKSRSRFQLKNLRLLLNGQNNFVRSLILQLKPLYIFSFSLSPLIIFEGIISNFGIFLLRHRSNVEVVGIYRIYQSIISLIQMLNSIWTKYLNPILIIGKLKKDKYTINYALSNVLFINTSIVLLFIVGLLYLYVKSSSILPGLLYYDNNEFSLILGLVLIQAFGFLGVIFTTIEKPIFMSYFVGLGSLGFAVAAILVGNSLYFILLSHIFGSIITICSVLIFMYFSDYRLRLGRGYNLLVNR